MNRESIMRIAFCVLLFFACSSCRGFAFQRTISSVVRTSSLFASSDSQQEGPRLYIPDDDGVMVNRQIVEANGVAQESSRTNNEIKMYLPDGDDDDMSVETTHCQQTTSLLGPEHVYAGIDEELLVSESNDFNGFFNGMNSNNHFQIDTKTWGAPEKKKTAAGKPMVLKHLFRYFTDICVDCWLSTVDPVDFLLSCNYTDIDIERMQQTFPRLTSLDVKAHLSPKVRFIVKTLGAGTGDICDGLECSLDDTAFIPHNCQTSQLGKTAVPPIFFGRRLEKTIGPRHAYLVHYGLPHGKELLENDGLLFQEFLDACDTPASAFAHLCNKWSLSNRRVGPFAPKVLHTSDTVEAFERASHRGILACAQNKHTADLEMVGCSPGRMVDLLLQHGANAIEHDRFGSSVLHWAAGTGNLHGAEALLEFLVEAGEGQDAAEILLNTAAGRDGATPLHWACCGVENGIFGKGGGHAGMCRLLLDKAGNKATELANVECFSGSTPLMWAAWSGSLDVVKLLLSRGADPHKKNRNEASIAHWAAAGGNLEICQYLHDELGVSFDGKSKEGNTPLNHASSNGNHDLVTWLKSLADESWRGGDAGQVVKKLDVNETVLTS